MSNWMPIWMQVVIGISGFVVAVALLWTKVVKPTAKLIATTDEMLPLMKELVTVFRDTPNSFKVLHEIAKQFKTDSGSSLRDAVNRLEEAAKEGGIADQENRIAGELLKVGVETARQLAKLDRDKIQELMLLIDRVSVKVEAGSATGLRMEKRAVGIADDLAVAKEAVKGVAQDLAEAHRRADETHPESPAGSAADAAAQQTKEEKKRD